MLAELILFADSKRIFGTWQEDCRYLHYIIARFGAFPNVIWCLANEWNYTGKPPAYWNHMGMLIRNEDPWMSEGDSLRALSIHQQTRYDFQFFDAAWPVHAVIQCGVRNDNPRLQYGDQWGNYSIQYNAGHSMPIVNDEFGYLGETARRVGVTATAFQTDLRQALWGIATAGGYGSVGDNGGGPGGCAIWNCGDWRHDPFYDDIKILVDFWTTRGIEFWKMSSRNDLVTSGSRIYVLADHGDQYIVYAAAGGSFEMTIAPGTYNVSRINPRTGSEDILEDLKGGGKKVFVLPDLHDWVIHIHRAW